MAEELSEYQKIARQFAAAKAKQKTAKPEKVDAEPRTILFKSQHLLAVIFFVWFL